MKTIKSALPKAGCFLLLFTLICGVIYPGIVTGAAQVLFKDKANGSMLSSQGTNYASSLIGQPFEGNEYLWGRAITHQTPLYFDEQGEPLYYPSASQLSPASDTYREEVEKRVAKIKETNPAKEGVKIPVDLVTGSGSGLDPQISKKAALYQVDRIAAARNMEKEEVTKIIDTCTTHKFLSIFGEDVVSVVKVNAMLDGKLN